MNNLEKQFQEQKIRFAQEQADLLARQEKEFQELVEKSKEQKPEFEIWKPEIGDQYIAYVPNFGDLRKSEFCESMLSEWEQKFRTKEQAELFRKRVLVYEILTKVAIELNGDWEPKDGETVFYVNKSFQVKRGLYYKDTFSTFDIVFKSESEASFAFNYLKKKLSERGIEL